MKKISVIIPVYNSEKYLKRCLESLVNQTYKCFEVIVIDDGSIDCSEKIYSEYKKLSNFTIIKQKNSGPSCARNNGLKKSTGDFVFFLDSDDYLDNDCFEKLIYNYKNNVLVGLKHKTIYDNKTKNNNYSNEYSLDTFIKNVSDGSIKGVVWGFLFEKSIIINNNILFDCNTSLSEDTIFLFEYIKNIDKICYINSYYNYYQSSTSITNSINIERIKRNINCSFYSIKCLNKLTNYNYKDNLNNAQIRLLKYELKKINKYSDFSIVLSDREVLDNILAFKKSNIQFKYKIYIFLILHFKFVLYFIFFIKKIVKRNVRG